MKALLEKEATRVAALVALATALVPLGLGRFGIWDPWELDLAEIARGAQDAPDGAGWPPLSRAIVAFGLTRLGSDVWGGRFPVALAGLLCLAAIYLWVRRYEGSRSAALATLVAMTTPLLLLNSRQLFGHAPAMLAQTAVGLAAGALALDEPDAEAARRGLRQSGWALLLAVSLVLAVGTAGVLLGALPPLLAVAGAAGATGRLQLDRGTARRYPGAYVVAGAGAVLAIGTVHAIAQDASSYSPFLGGVPQGGEPPTFDAGLERAFHALAPWSGLAAIALARMLRTDEGEAGGDDAGGDAEAVLDRSPRRAFRLSLVLWATFAYAALTVFTSRYGAATYLAVAPVAAATGIFLREVAASRRSYLTAAVLVLLFTALLVRDYAAYPASATAGIPLADLRLPPNFDPKRAWAIVFGVFAGLALVVLGVGAARSKPDLRAPYRFVRARFRSGFAARAWTVPTLVLLALVLVFGVYAWVAGYSDSLRIVRVSWLFLDLDFEVSTLAIRVGRILFFVPLAIPLLVAAGQLVVAGAGRLGRYRIVPLALAGAAAGLYTVWGFQAALGQHLSPREVFDTLRELRAGAEEPLAEMHVGARSVRYYVGTEVQSVGDVPSLTRFLTAEERRWAVFPADKLADVDRAFRAATGRHLFVADAESGRVLLGTNQPIAGRDDQNQLTHSILSEPPTIAHRLDAQLGTGIELLGYDLDLPHEDHVGGSEAFTLTWYWRSAGPSPGPYKVFVHIEGHGNRLNGDHDPVEGHYPVRLWQPGDVVVDRQELRVPGNYAVGDYAIYVGLFRGDQRLPVTRGTQDGQDRLRVGMLRIR